VSPSLAPAEIQALAGILDELDYYQLLEVDVKAPSSSIRSAYHRVSRRYHPDLHRRLDPDLRDGIGLISKRVAEAYSVLRDARRRRIYDQQLAASGEAGLRVPLVQAQAEAHRQRRETEGRTPKGRKYFAMAQSDLARSDRASAERNLRMALTFEPDNIRFREMLAEMGERR